MLKTTEEVGELAKAVLKKDWANAREELADAAITLHHVARALGTDLVAEMCGKLLVIEKRLEKK